MKLCTASNLHRGNVFMPHAYILGINLSHDSSVCLMKEGFILNATALERQTRIKHYQVGMHSHPEIYKAIRKMLSKNKIKRDDCELLLTEHPDGRFGAYPHNIQSLPIKKEAIRTLPCPSHHLAHAYSSFFCSPFEESVVYVCDTFGSMLENGYARESETAFLFSEKEQKLFERKTRKVGEINIGRFYEGITSILGFSSPSITQLFGFLGESGKTMALASFGNERKDFPDFSEDYASKNHISCEDFHGFLFEHGLLNHEIDYKTLRQNFPEDISWEVQIRQKNEPITQFHKDLAHLSQKTLEEKILSDLGSLHEKTGISSLCLAGGTFLNCSLNRRILEETGFKKVFVQPAATDDGNAIGCAMYGYHKLSKTMPKKRFQMGMPFFGVSYTKEETERAVRKFSKEKIEPSINAYSKIAAALAKGKFTGFFIGGAEFGPRALGHRSILADPRRAETKDRLNRIKGREPFRPFAPAILDEHAEDYFHLPKNSRLLTRYMLVAVKAKEEKKKLIPAVMHVDGTARVQTVTKKENPGLYDVIAEFQKITGIPLVLNTSFNFKGRPIVETPLDAMKEFLESELDLLFIEPFLIEKKNRKGRISLKVV